MEEFYNKNYKKFIFIPLLIVLISIIVIINQYQNTGDIVNKDVTLKGGLSIEIYTKDSIDENLIKQTLENKFPGGDFFIRKLAEFTTEQQNGIIIESSDIKEEDIKRTVKEILKIELIDSENYFVTETSSTLGESFYRQMIFTILLAFLFMAVTVIIVYRTFIPSLAIIMAPIINMIVTIAIVDIIGFRVSTATVAAILLMIGYSIDTDILLTTKVVKRKEGRVFERIKESFTTGITMTSTTLAALIFASFVAKSLVIKEMFIILIIGLTVDVISTYLMNAGLLRWYLKNED